MYSMALAADPAMLEYPQRQASLTQVCEQCHFMRGTAAAHAMQHQPHGGAQERASEPARGPYTGMSADAATLPHRDHLLASYAAAVAKELAADADKLNLAKAEDEENVALGRNTSLLSRMKSLLQQDSGA